VVVPVVVLLPVFRNSGLDWQARAAAPRPPRHDAPNIVVVIADSLNARAMSLYGAPLPTTPALEALAQRGVTVQGLTASSNFTVPTTATLLTGVEPAVHRAFALESYFLKTPDFDPDLSLPAQLHAAGYETSAIVDNPNGDPRKFWID